MFNEDFIDITQKLAEQFLRNDTIIRNILIHVRRCHIIKYCTVNMTTEKCNHCDCQFDRCIKRSENTNKHSLVRYTEGGFKTKPCGNTCQFASVKHQPQSLRNISAYRYLTSSQKNPTSIFYDTAKELIEMLKMIRRHLSYIDMYYCYCLCCEPEYYKVNYNPFRRNYLNIYLP